MRSRYHVVNTRTGEIVNELPRLVNPRIYRVRRASQLNQDIALILALVVLLVVTYLYA